MSYFILFYFKPLFKFSCSKCTQVHYLAYLKSLQFSRNFWEFFQINYATNILIPFLNPFEIQKSKVIDFLLFLWNSARLTFWPSRGPASPALPGPLLRSSLLGPSTGPAGHLPLSLCLGLWSAQPDSSLSSLTRGPHPLVFLLRLLGHNTAATCSHALPPLARPLLSQKRPPPPPILQTPPVAPGSPPETAAHHHQWHRPSSLHPTISPPSSSPYKRARCTPGHQHTHPALLCSLLSPQPPPH
jgi:hypothetical protein